jgi:hypothetical protein
MNRSREAVALPPNKPYLDSSHKLILSNDAGAASDCSRISGLLRGAFGLLAMMEVRARGANQ